MNLTTSDADTNPAAPGKGKGPTWAGGIHDDLKLPSGATIGSVDNEKLRAELARLGIEGSHSDGRHILCARYARLLQQVFNSAGEKAVAEFLQEKRG
jgi:hypothetical protein